MTGKHQAPQVKSRGSLLPRSYWFLHSVEVSRPGFWFITLWLYVVACGGNETLVSQVPFWVGLFYCLYPLNLLTFAWNDLGDVRLDSINPRKGIYLLGVNNVADSDLLKLRNMGLLINGMFGVYFASVIGLFKILLLGSIVIGANFLYNEGPRFREGPPPLDLLGSIGYIFVLQLGTWLNNLEPLPKSTWLFHAFMILRSQLWGQIIDLKCDAKSGRRTTAVTLGIRRARLLLAFIVFCELSVAYLAFEDIYVSYFSGLSFMQALVEIFIYPNEPPTLHLAALTGLVMTPAAGLLLPRVWFYGSFR
mmetsp:Transcript_3744/g.4312  ORF Transcript_3744/g.4312 Transcript_3744/m.4312 type:complete len:306 (+) Transcript_3744:194-1111(+)